MAVPCARPAEREGQFIVLTPRSAQPVFVTALPGGGDWGVGGSSRSSLRQTQSSAPDRSNGCGGADGGASVPGRRGLPRQVSGRIVSGCSAREVTYRTGAPAGGEPGPCSGSAPLWTLTEPRGGKTKQNNTPLRVPPAKRAWPPTPSRPGLSRQQTTSRTGLRESPVTLGTESCGNSCRDFAGEAPTKLFRLAIGPRTRLPWFPCANIGLSVKQD